MNLSVFQKGLILVIVSLLSQLVFLLVAVRFQSDRITLLIGGGAVAVGCTLALAYAFHLGIARRFAALETNTRRLTAGEPLTPPLVGADEIARLDRAFRDMAAGLSRATDDLRDLYDHAPCGYHSVDSAGVFMAVNRTELRWLGYEANEAVGRMRFADMVSPASRDAYQRGFAVVREKGSVTDVELELVRKDGTTFPVLVTSTSIRDADGRYVRSRTMLTDLTERKRAEDAVRQLNAELEERVRERTAELEMANRDLAQKNTENEMFVYSVSHDLRSPLVNLQGFSKELEKAARGLTTLISEESVPPDVRERAQTLLDGKAAKSIGFIQTAVMRLSGIIDALLRLSRAGRVDYRWEVVDVAAVIGQVVGAAQATIAERGAEVRAGPLPPAWGDRTAVEQVFANLVGNALTYLDPARPGVIEVGAEPDDGDGPTTYFVRDNGLGIAEGHRQKIFQAFQRAHPGVGSGEGLGLAIVARVVERHHGRVWVESRPGEGSTFFVRLPRRSLAQSGALPARATIRGEVSMLNHELVILLAEDDDGHAYLVQQNLMDAGLVNKVVRVRDGQEALDFIRCEGEFVGRDRNGPLLLLLDINMPRVDGVEVLRRLKADPKTVEIPVIVLTTTDDPREVKRCYELGCSSYVTKPVEYDRFVEAIRRLGLFLTIVQIPREDA